MLSRTSNRTMITCHSESMSWSRKHFLRKISIKKPYHESWHPNELIILLVNHWADKVPHLNLELEKSLQLSPFHSTLCRQSYHWWYLLTHLVKIFFRFTNKRFIASMNIFTIKSSDPHNRNNIKKIIKELKIDWSHRHLKHNIFYWYLFAFYFGSDVNRRGGKH